MRFNPSEILAASILIVDDQPANVTLLERCLAEAGYANVTSTLVPHEAAVLHRRHAYDLILLDLQMPGMDGFQVMQSMRSDGIDGYLPVIVLTAQPAHKLRALEAGAKDFISKPFDLLEVKTRIHNMLEVRLLYKKLGTYNEQLEYTVQMRTAELRESENRYRRLTDLASDWYWEQNEAGSFTHIAGPVIDMVGIRMAAFLGEPGGDEPSGWNEEERQALQAAIASREAFRDFAFSRTDGNGAQQNFRVSGEPMFDPSGRFTGYRGIGSEVPRRRRFETVTRDRPAVVDSRFAV